MTKLTLRFEDGLVRQGLEDLEAEIPKIGRRRIYAMMNRVTRRLEVYPPERHSVTSQHAVLGKVFHRAKGYQRTGRYGRSWTVTSLADGYTLENRAARKGREYAVYVAGDAYGGRQAWMHQGRWAPLRDTVDDEIAKEPAAIEREIVMVARREGLEASA